MSKIIDMDNLDPEVMGSVMKYHKPKKNISRAWRNKTPKTKERKVDNLVDLQKRSLSSEHPKPYKSKSRYRLRTRPLRSNGKLRILSTTHDADTSTNSTITSTTSKGSRKNIKRKLRYLSTMTDVEPPTTLKKFRKHNQRKLRKLSITKSVAPPTENVETTTNTPPPTTTTENVEATITSVAPTIGITPPTTTTTENVETTTASVEPTITKVAPLESKKLPSIHYARVGQVIAFKDHINPMAPFQTKGPSGGRGSGFFIKTDSPTPRFITAAHVVSSTYLDGGVKLSLPNVKTRNLDARVISFIPEVDLAVLELCQPLDSGVNIEGYELGDDKQLTIGDSLTVVGYPMGDDNLKVIKSSFNGLQGGVIQMDGAINPGNSGGPALHNGKVVGIISSGYDPQKSNNVAFAIPISIFKALYPLDPLKSHPSPKVIRIPSMGMMYHNGSESCTQISTPECANGVIVQWVSEYSAFKGLIEPGYRICTMSDGTNTYDVDNFGEVTVSWYNMKIALPHVLATIPTNKPITLTVWKPDKKSTATFTKKLTLTQHGGYKATYYPFEEIDYEVFGGIVVMPLRLQHFLMFPHLQYAFKPSEKEKEHLIISYVMPNSQFAEFSVISPGSILTEVNGMKITTMDTYRKALLQSKTCVKWIDSENGSIQLQLADILKNEPILSKTFKFNLSEIYTALQKNK